MTAAQQIPGTPWTYEVHQLSEGFSGIVYDSHGQRVGTDHLTEAEAALIAAAPELLTALQNAVHALQYCLNHHMPDDEMLRPKCQKNIDTARAVIAKAVTS